MANTDRALGMEIHELLVHAGKETPLVPQDGRFAGGTSIQDCFEAILGRLGLDLLDDSLQNTPRRVAKMYEEEIFYGLDYNNFPKCSVFENKMQADEMVCVKRILVRSVCEHHLIPFMGHATIAYIPSENILGLSKFNRVIDFFCRRPQVQERLTEQVVCAFKHILKTDDVALLIEADHLCVKLRGVQDPHSATVTSKLCGRFRSVPELRNEFLQIAHNQ